MTQEHIETLQAIALHAREERCDQTTIAAQISDVIRDAAPAKPVRTTLETIAADSLLRRKDHQTVAEEIAAVIRQFDNEYELPPRD